MATGGHGASTDAAGRSRRRLVLAAALGALVVVVVGAAAAIAARGSSGGDDDPAPPSSYLDVAVVGDSLIEQSRDQLEAHADDRGLTVETWAFGGSAPCDWMDVFEDLAGSPPAHLVVSFAGNDNTPCIHPGGGPPRDPAAIAAAYADMMPPILDRFADTGTEVYLAVPPPVGEPASEPAAAAIRTVYRDLAADRPWLTIVDPAPLLGPDGGFYRALPCEPWEVEAGDCGRGGTVTVRRDDGIHLTEAGGERYARTILSALGHPVED